MEKDITLQMMDESIMTRMRKIARGLRAPKDSGDYRYAKFEMIRLSSSFGTSVGLSVLIVMILFVFAVGQVINKDAAVEVVVMTPETVKLDEIKQEIQKVEEPPPDDSIAMDAPVMGDASPVDVPGPKTADSTPVSTTPIMTKSPLILKGLPGTLANRTAGARAGALRRHGGSGRGEEAVLRALRWLKNHQDEDGSWTKAEPRACPALAGLALLCFLAHGETPASVEFGQTVEKAMKYLVSQQGSDGGFGVARTQGGAYQHGICTYAISEGFAMTKIMALKDAMDKGVKLITDGQQPQGGFDYGYAKGARWDLSVAGWQFQALKAAKMAGYSGPELEPAVEKGIDFLRKQAFSVQHGGFGYAGTPGAPGASAKASMTGAGTLCLQLLGKANVPEVKAGMEYLLVNWPASSLQWNNKSGNSVYALYYITQAKFQQGGKDWDEWNKQFSPMLIKAQETDGHWKNGDHGGDVYTTALCCLMLEVYYRYLPTYQKVADEGATAKATASDDVVVDVR